MDRKLDLLYRSIINGSPSSSVNVLSSLGSIRNGINALNRNKEVSGSTSNLYVVNGSMMSITSGSSNNMYPTFVPSNLGSFKGGVSHWYLIEDTFGNSDAYYQESSADVYEFRNSGFYWIYVIL